MEELTLNESNRLIHLEKIVTTGLQGWIEVGEALIEIRDSRLYKIEAATFEEYCQTRFKMSKSYAHRVMDAAPIAREMVPLGTVTETAIRELKKVEPERRQEIFNKATEAAQGHVPTARVIKQVAEMEEAPYPIETIKHTERSLAELEQSRKDSENLSNLKWTWKRASKADRSSFLEWIL